MAFIISTTGVQATVTFDDLGKRAFAHPTVDYDLELNYTQEQIRQSTDVQNAIDNNWITVKDADGNPVTDVTEAVFHSNLGGLLNDDHTQYSLNVSARP